ncbi:hypothetical protein AAFN88_11000 [Pelagibius sp. CAU 1746]
MEAQIVRHVRIAARRRLPRLFIDAAGRRLVQRQAETLGQPFGGRKGVRPFAFEGAFGRQLQQIVKPLPLGLCESD